MVEQPIDRDGVSQISHPLTLAKQVSAVKR
jgi:hypothetical protein